MLPIHSDLNLFIYKYVYCYEYKRLTLKGINNEANVTI
jgi:hypothetical protein